MQNEQVINEMVKELIQLKDQNKIRENLVGLRWRRDVANEDFFKVFTLVVLNVIGRRENEQANKPVTIAVTSDDPLKVVETFLDREDCNYKRYEHAIHVSFNGDNGNLNVLIIKPKDHMHMLFEVPNIMKVPKKTEAQVIETITRINSEHILGAFDYEFDTGELNFRVPLPLAKGDLPSFGQIGACLAVCCLFVDKCFPEIAKMCWQ